MSLGDKHAKNGPVDGLVPIDPFTSFSSNLSRSKKSQALLSKSYVMEQGAGDDVIFGAEDDDRVVDDGSFSDYITRFHKRNLQSEMNTDGKANAYIRRFHEKNSREYTLAASTGVVPMVLPPPPNPSLNN
ncbi:hypothetical protein Salat_1292300 [Sesamum alatum]|uniref:Uncharacterized protein n=1 Tax=Sesamum alatum TaxID=300844 RepID=A0AAE1YHF7_9LAMI|nr:hypothetical protein Salat_1292300 [Sesamum alatum]